MPWKVSGVVKKRKEFMKQWLSQEWTMTELCARHGISRQAGYNTLARYEQAGWEGFEERSRAPRCHPNQTPAGIEQQIVDLRHQHMRWGPRKLKVVLEAGPDLAGRQHDRRTVAPRRADHCAQEAAPHRPL